MIVDNTTINLGENKSNQKQLMAEKMFFCELCRVQVAARAFRLSDHKKSKRHSNTVNSAKTELTLPKQPNRDGKTSLITCHCSAKKSKAVACFVYCSKIVQHANSYEKQHTLNILES